MTITQTNGNARNGICGTRVRVTAEDGTLIGEVTARTWHENGLRYIEKHPRGHVAETYRELVDICYYHEASVAAAAADAKKIGIREED